MKASISVRSRPVREAGFREPQIEGTVVPEDESDYTRPGADIVALTDAEWSESRFLFIGETGHSRPKGAARRLVRSQAKRNLFGRKQNRPKQVVRQLRPNFGLDRSKGPDRSKEPSNSACPSGQLIQLIQRISKNNPGWTSNKFDPFNILPGDESGNAYYLFGNIDPVCHSIFNPPYSPVKPIEGRLDLLKMAVFDTSWFHLACAHISITLSRIRCTAMKPEAIYHLGQAISIVNKRIANFHHESATEKDETIGCVLPLAFFEVRRSKASGKIHLDGLEALVKSRGGIKALLASNRTIAKQTIWNDVVGAWILGSEPYWEVEIRDMATGPDLHPEHYSGIAARYQSRLSTLTGLPDLSQETIKVYSFLRHLIMDKETLAGVQEMGIAEADFQFLQNFSFYVAYRLVAITRHQLPETTNRKAVLIYKLFANAGMVHILLFTWNTPTIIRGDPRLISTRFRELLEMIDVQAYQIAYPEMILWIITIGGLASIGSVNQPWFIKLLAQSCRAAGIAGQAELASLLADFLWSGFYLGHIFNGFWADLKREISKGSP
ncbi:hypothetical protein V8E51_019161 [Hyaloscypha variabilis]